MGSQGNNGNASTKSTRTTQPTTQTQDPNPLGRQGSLYSLTLDEVQNQLGDLGKPLSSMNLDELLKNVWLAEGNSSLGGLGGLNVGSNPPQSASASSLNRQSSLTLSMDLSKKTVDEVWQDIQHQHKKGNLDRNATLGEMTLEDFLVKAGVVAEPPQVKENAIEVTGRVSVSPIPIPQQPSQQPSQWNVNYPAPSIVPQPQPSMVPIYVPVQPVVDFAYAESHVNVASSPMIGCGALSDNQTPRRKRMAPEDIAERSVERRQKRMIKNRESAARSRARKQAYTHELENKISRLEEENERLRRQHEWEKALPTIPPPPEPKHRLRRTSSASF